MTQAMVKQNDVEKKQALESILASNEFERDTIYQDLLRFLVESTLAGQNLKEYSIAIDFFHKTDHFDPAEDNSVRYRIYKLREKLQRYYNSEGKQDPLRIDIPKGHYDVSFSRQSISPPSASPEKKLKQYLRFSLPGILAAFLILIYHLYYIKSNVIIQQPISREDPVWSQFFANGLPTTLMIGDFFVFHELDTDLGYSRRNLDYKIYNQHLFQQYKESFPERKSQPEFFGEVPHNLSANIIDLIHVFYSFNQKFALQWTTQASSTDLSDQNIIYIGEFVNMRIIHNILSQTSFQIKNLIGKPVEFTIEPSNDPQNKQTYRISPGWSPNEKNVDYGFVAKVPGLRNENYLIIAGFEYASQVDLVRMLSNQQRLSLLETQISQLNGKVPDYFEIFFEVTGLGMVAYNSEILYFNEIDPQAFKAATLNRIREQENYGIE